MDLRFKVFSKDNQFYRATKVIQINGKRFELRLKIRLLINKANLRFREFLAFR